MDLPETMPNVTLKKRRRGGKRSSSNKNVIKDFSRTRLGLEILTAAGSILTPLLFWYFTSVQIKDSRVINEATNATTQRSLKLTEEANRTAIAALNENKRINGENIEFSRQDYAMRESSTKKQLRAYIITDDVVVDSVSQNFFFFTMTFANTGSTPAKNVIIDVDVKPDGTGIYESEFNKFKKVNRNGALQGNGFKFYAKCASPRICSVDAFNKIQKGEIPFYIFGYIYYKDVFGEEHKTRICQAAIRLEDGQYTMSKHPDFNDGD